VGKSAYHHAEALIECEPGRSRRPTEAILLLDRRVETQLEGGVSAHLDRASHAPPTTPPHL